jgi:hypothetical protein
MSTWDERMAPHQKQEPRLELVEMCWRMRSRQQALRILECGVFRTDAGLEVRVSYAPDDLLQSQRAQDIGTGRDIAERWRQAVFEKSGFPEVEG